MGPSKFPSVPKLEVVCKIATGANADKHLVYNKKYTVDAIVPKGAKTAKGATQADAYSLRGVNHLWDATRFDRA